LNDLVLLDLDQAISIVAPHYQLAYVAKGWGLDSEIMTAFINGYGIDCNTFSEILPIVKGSLVLQAMRSVRWAEDRNPSWLERNIESARKAIVEHVGAELGMKG